MTDDQPQREGFFKRFLVTFLGALAAGCFMQVVSFGFVIGLILILSGASSVKPSKFEEHVVSGTSANNRIAVINIAGEIVSEIDGQFDVARATAEKITAQLDAAAADESVKAVILHISSPGGTVMASDEIYKKVKETRGKKKVVTVMNEVAASGGYYIAAGSETIYAHPETLTGSIGVIFEVPNLSGLLEKTGVGITVFKSGEHKDIGSPFREIDKEEAGIFQGLVDEAFDRFVAVVAEGRKLTPAKVKELSGGGRVYSGRQAKAIGLVDKEGNLKTAIDELKQSGISENAQVFEYKAAAGISGLLTESLHKWFRSALPVTPKPTLEYLWRT